MYVDLQLEHSSTVGRAADELRRAIFAGGLEPGTPLREVALAEALGVGRSTIREALALLVSDGLAVRAPNRGVAVKELSPRDVSDISLARVSLELSGVRRWPDASEVERATVRSAVERYSALARHTKDSGVLTEAHLQIHRALVALTGSARLVAAADAYSAELRLGLAHLDRIRGNIAEQVGSHRRLLDLLEADDIEATVAELARHLALAEGSLHGAIGHGTIEP